MRRTASTHFDPRAFTALNHEFHQTLYVTCPNPALLDVVERGWTRLAAIRDSTFSFVPGRAHESVAEHDQILALIRSSAEPTAIETCCRAHRLATLDAFLDRAPLANDAVQEDLR